VSEHALRNPAQPQCANKRPTSDETAVVSMGAFFDGGLSELFEGVPVPVPVRYRGEREPELEEAGAVGQISPACRTQGRVSARSCLTGMRIERRKADVRG
jgi:hypothetical protein